MSVRERMSESESERKKRGEREERKGMKGGTPKLSQKISSTRRES